MATDGESNMTTILALFEKADFDGNGVISPTELLVILDEIDPGKWNKDRINELLTQVDLNADGSLDVMEFIAFLSDDEDWHMVQNFTKSRYITAASFDSCQSVLVSEKLDASVRAVAGHMDDFKFSAKEVYKLMTKGDCRGRVELEFLRSAVTCPQRSPLVDAGLLPAYLGTSVDPASGETWVKMTRVDAGMVSPLIMDIKMGTRTYNTAATQLKAARQRKSDMSSTSHSLGFKICGCTWLSKKDREGGGTDMHTNPERVPEVLGKILSNPDLRASVLEKLGPIRQWLEDQTAFAFYGSSLLLACDENEARDCRVCFIDFCNHEKINCKEEDVSGVQIGLTNLTSMIGQL